MLLLTEGLDLALGAETLCLGGARPGALLRLLVGLFLFDDVFERLVHLVSGRHLNLYFKNLSHGRPPHSTRFLLLRLTEEYEVDIEWHCKPLTGDWNGSGMHANFSTEYMRETGGKDYFLALMDAFERNRDEHIAAYGPDNHMRLTGLHETQSIDQFSWGIADRGASIRVPHSFANNDWKGYLEDRRPNSQGDPYAIASRILKTVAEVPTS